MIRSIPHWNFSRKVLIPILLIMAALVAFTTLFMNVRFHELIREQATVDLLNSERMFHQYMTVRLNELQRLASSIPTDNRVRAAAQLEDSNTISGLLQDLVQENNLDGIAYADPNGKILVARGPQAKEIDRIPGLDEHMKRLYNGLNASWLTAIDDQPVELGAAPVFVGMQLSGVILVLQSVDEMDALNLSRLTGCEIAFFVNGSLPVTTWRDPRQRREFDRMNTKRGPIIPSAAIDGKRPQVADFSLNNEHFMGFHQRLETSGHPISAMLVASYEAQIQYLKETSNRLLLVGLLSIVLGGCVAGFVIRRVTAPLKSLQENVEAVGRGEFHRRVPSDSQDEIGQLANSFNQMTTNLDQSNRDLEAARNQLVQSEKLSALGEFIAGIAHELNNPLTVMVGYSQLLAESDLDEEVQEDLKQIADSAERCQSVVKNLLSFARQRPPERVRVDVNDLLDSTIRFMYYELRTSGIRIEKNLSSDLAFVMGDPHQLQQVFLNLARNAQQAMDECTNESCLTVSTTNDDSGEVEIRVQDSGTGIPPKVIDKIFDPFYTSKQAGKGTGLGLSVSYGIIREHGGQIYAESPPGEGATFVIRLPSLSKDAAWEPEPAHVRTPPSLGHLRRLLVVDDEVGILRMVQDILQPYGFEIDATDQARKGLELLASRDYDIILSDWKMPDMNGQEFFETWKLSAKQTNTRFIFMTGDVLNTDLQAYLDLHDASYLEKPFNGDELTDRIAEACTVPCTQQ